MCMYTLLTVVSVDTWGGGDMYSVHVYELETGCVQELACHKTHCPGSQVSFFVCGLWA